MKIIIISLNSGKDATSKLLLSLQVRSACIYTSFIQLQLFDFPSDATSKFYWYVSVCSGKSFISFLGGM